VIGADLEGVAKTFRPYQPEQLLLLPPSLNDWVPERHLARFISEVVEDLDLSAIEGVYEEERGYPPYHPRMMTKVLLYAYATGVYSSRRMAARLIDSVPFRFLSAGNEPDFRTISRFRKEHGAALSELFGQVVRLCREAGLVRLGRVAVDGTKIKANASKHKAMSYGRMKDKENQIEREIAAWLKKCDEIDEQEDRAYGKDRRGDELPEELATREGRLKKIREAKAALEAEAREKAKAKGKDPKMANPPDKAQRNFTDPESRIMKGRDGFIQGYNAQVAVDDHSQVIVAQHVTDAAPDVEQLLPVVNAVGRLLKRRPKQVLADAGYYSEANVAKLQKRGIDPFIATRRLKHQGELSPAPRGRIPTRLSVRQRMERKLRTVRGRAIYALRKVIPEPVFGQIKHARGFRQFLRRGRSNVAQEWSLVCTAHNLLKLYAATA
jgi:transposase/IS5 family transposase